jgi:hypothetical protein
MMLEGRRNSRRLRLLEGQCHLEPLTLIDFKV